MGRSLEQGITQTLDLRGLSKVMIEMHIVRRFTASVERLSLSCEFDEDPSEAFRELRTYATHWNFQRLGPTHWLARNHR